MDLEPELVVRLGNNAFRVRNWIQLTACTFTLIVFTYFILASMLDLNPSITVFDLLVGISVTFNSVEIVISIRWSFKSYKNLLDIIRLNLLFVDQGV